MLLLVLPPHTGVAAASPAIWHGSIAGMPAWITVIPAGHRISAATQRSKPWWQWGNTTSDAYLFAFGRAGNVRLALSFGRQANGLPRAYLYANERGQKPLDYSLQGAALNVPATERYLLVRALGGPWLIGGRANYNLTIEIAGPSGLGNVFEAEQGLTRTEVQVRETSPGVPAWETSRLLNDPHPDWGYPRFSAALPMAGAPPFRVEPATMPTFPYLEIGRGNSDMYVADPQPLYFDLFHSTLSIGSFVGFDTSGIYRINSLSLPPNTDFEAPFAFYGFRPGTRSPSMVVRAEAFPAHDRFAPIPGERASAGFRLSWKTADPRLWEYSLDVAGFAEFGQTVRIRSTRIRAPAPAHYPGWVTGKAWPMATFVQAVHGYAGSEGIYSYTVESHEPRAWLAGQASAPPAYLADAALPQRATIVTTALPDALPPGFRGEYSASYFRKPVLYASPVDGLLHLLGASGGTWNLGNCRVLREQNLEGGAHIDAWTLGRAGDLGCRHASVSSEQIFVMDGLLVYSGSRGVAIREAGMPSELVRLAPPANRRSWQEFVRAAAPYQSGRSPLRLWRWVDAFPGPLVRLGKARVSDLVVTAGGFQFVLEVRAARGVTGDPLTRLASLPPGTYVVSYTAAHQAWRVQRGSGPRVSVSLAPGQHISAYQPASVRLVLRNGGDAAWSGPVSVVAGQGPLLQGTFAVPAHGSRQVAFAWSPAAAGRAVLSVEVGSGTVRSIAIPVETTARPAVTALTGDSLPLPGVPPLAMLIGLGILGGTWVVARRVVGHE